MIKLKILILVVIITLSSGILFADESVEDDPGLLTGDEEETAFNWQAGIYFIPLTNWQFLYIYGDERLSYDIQSRSSAYEVNFRMWPFSFGTTAAVDDNIIGKISQIMGYVSYERISVKISRSDLRGKGYWSGPYGYDTEPSFDLHNTVKTIDILYNGDFKLSDAAGGPTRWYAGLTYTDFDLPLQIYTNEYAWNGGGGEPFYDEHFGGKSYGLTFGINSLKERNKPDGWGMLTITQDWFTMGKYSLSDRAVVRGEALNPGYLIGEREATGTYIYNETALGLTWTKNFTSGCITFAVGYDLVWGNLGVFSEGTGTQPGVLAWTQESFFFRHGIIFAVYGIW